jgi:hypothetical protein
MAGLECEPDGREDIGYRRKRRYYGSIASSKEECSKAGKAAEENHQPLAQCDAILPFKAFLQCLIALSKTGLRLWGGIQPVREPTLKIRAVKALTATVKKFFELLILFHLTQIYKIDKYAFIVCLARLRCDLTVFSFMPVICATSRIGLSSM